MRDWILDQPGIHQHAEAISPEVFRAQRQAEIEQLSKYRLIKIQQYKDWADPVKRAEKKLQYAKDEAEGRKLLKDIPAEQIAVRSDYKINYREIFKPLQKLTMWQKIKRFLGFK